MEYEYDCAECLKRCLSRIEILEDIFYCEYLCGCEVEELELVCVEDPYSYSNIF